MHRLIESLSRTSVPCRLFWRFACESKSCSLLTSSIALLCCAYIALASGPLIAAEPDKSLKQQLLTAAPAAWERWREWTVHTEAEFSEEELRHSSPGKPISVVDFQYHLKGMTRRRHLIRTLPDGRRFEEVAIRHGDEYYFTAERYNDGPLIVTGVRPGPADDSERTVPPQLEAPYTVYYRYLAELVKNPRFRFDVSAVDGKETSERVRITFTYDWKGEQSPRLREGWIELCPRDDWSVQEFLIKESHGVLIHTKIQYGEGSGPQRPLVEVSTSYLGEDGKAKGDQTLARFKKQALSDEPDEFYSFSAVGLPELNMSSHRARNTYTLIILTVGIILIVLAIFARRHRRPKGVTEKFTG